MKLSQLSIAETQIQRKKIKNKFFSPQFFSIVRIKIKRWIATVAMRDTRKAFFWGLAPARPLFK